MHQLALKLMFFREYQVVKKVERGNKVLVLIDMHCYWLKKKEWVVGVNGRFFQVNRVRIRTENGAV